MLKQRKACLNQRRLQGRLLGLLLLCAAVTATAVAQSASPQASALLRQYQNGAELSAAQLMDAAAAARSLGASDPQLFKTAVRIYDQAISADPQNLPARVALGNLLLEKYNNAEARELFDEALALNPKHPPALLGLARSQHFDFSPEALQTVATALQLDPSYAAARAFLAKLFIELEQYDDAEREARAALRDASGAGSAAETDSAGAILPALSMLAAVHYLSGDRDGFADAERRALQINPRYAELYNVLAELAARTRFYQDAVKFAAEAVRLDPQSWRGHGLLGMNQLRVGAIDAGRASLQAAFRGDPYNVWVKNMLDLTDTFGDYELVQNDKFALFLHRDEHQLLTPYLFDIAEQAYDYFQRAYDYRAQTPIRIELYPRHADFSVRTVGLAGVGILGVSFGPVVAMDSPSGRPLGTFNWGSTLWHELAHTFHLGLSEHRVPRWFSEGLAVFEERRATGRPGWGGDVSIDFLIAYRDGKLLPVSELNNGFVRPSYPQQVIHSYYQASLVFDFIDRDWGFAAIRAMLRGFADGSNTEQLIERTLALTPQQFDRRFDAYFRERFASPLAALRKLPGPNTAAIDADANTDANTETDTETLTEAEADKPAAADAETPAELAALADQYADHFALQMRAAAALLDAESTAAADLPDAERYLLRAQQLFPEYAGDDSSYRLLARLYRQRGNEARAAEQLQQLIDINAEHYRAHVELADLYRELGQPALAADALARSLYIYPFSRDAQRQLAELYGELEQWPQAVLARRSVLALAPVDMADAYYRLAEAHHRAGERRAARRELLRALEFAPNFEPALELLLELRASKPSSGS